MAFMPRFAPAGRIITRGMDIRTSSAHQICVPSRTNLGTMRFMLRDFIYLDQRIVNQFLAQ
jgi:hypothetical protein